LTETRFAETSEGRNDQSRRQPPYPINLPTAETGKAQRKALRRKLPDQALRPCSHGDAHRDLAGPGRPPCKLEVSHIGASNREQQSDDGAQDDASHHKGAAAHRFRFVR
jgi:hypothetical protein